VTELDVIAPATVADRDVEKPVGRPERNGAAVVVRLRLVDLQEDPLGAGIRPIRIARHAVFGERGRGIESGGGAGTKGRAVVDEEAPIRRVLWMEGEPEEPTFVSGRLTQGNDLASDIEERLWQERPLTRHDANQPDLVDDEQPAGSIVHRDDQHR